MARRSDAGVEQSFIGVDVADTVEERLVEQRRLNGGLAVAEEGGEVFERDREGFGAGAFVSCVGRDDGEAAEAAGVDEAEFFAAAEGEDGVSVRGDGRVGGGDEQATGHAEMDEELGGFFLSD
ncbi:MAG: hypothetical protein JWQ49_1740 [Edaphobacter sp.]|nr:hypothetical protein [Edaphobacter sp.]